MTHISEQQQKFRDILLTRRELLTVVSSAVLSALFSSLPRRTQARGSFRDGTPLAPEVTIDSLLHSVEVNVDGANKVFQFLSASEVAEQGGADSIADLKKAAKISDVMEAMGQGQAQYETNQPAWVTADRRVFLQNVGREISPLNENPLNRIKAGLRELHPNLEQTRVVRVLPGGIEQEVTSVTYSFLGMDHKACLHQLDKALPKLLRVKQYYERFAKLYRESNLMSYEDYVATQTNPVLTNLKIVMHDREDFAKVQINETNSNGEPTKIEVHISDWSQLVEEVLTMTVLPSVLQRTNKSTYLDKLRGHRVPYVYEAISDFIPRIMYPESNGVGFPEIARRINFAATANTLGLANLTPVLLLLAQSIGVSSSGSPRGDSEYQIITEKAAVQLVSIITRALTNDYTNDPYGILKFVSELQNETGQDTLEEDLGSLTLAQMMILLNVMQSPVFESEVQDDLQDGSDDKKLAQPSLVQKNIIQYHQAQCSQFAGLFDNLRDQRLIAHIDVQTEQLLRERGLTGLYMTDQSVRLVNRHEFRVFQLSSFSTKLVDKKLVAAEWMQDTLPTFFTEVTFSRQDGSAGNYYYRLEPYRDGKGVVSFVQSESGKSMFAGIPRFAEIDDPVTGQKRTIEIKKLVVHQSVQDIQNDGTPAEQQFLMSLPNITIDWDS